jgi:hypothetical protein
MSLTIEGFDIPQSISQLGVGIKFRLSGTGSKQTFTAGLYGGTALRNAFHGTFSSDGVGVQIGTFSSGSTLRFGMRVRIPARTGGDENGSIFETSHSGIGQLRVGITSAGYLALYTGSSETPLVISSLFLVADVWYYLSVVCVLGGAGTFQLYRGNDLALTYSGSTLPSSTDVNEIFLGNTSSSVAHPACDYDDFYAGASEALKDVRVEPLSPGSTTSSTFALSAGATVHEALNDESAGPDGITSYISGDTAGQKFKVGLTDSLTGDPLAIYGVSLDLQARKTGAGSVSLTPFLDSGTTEYPAAAGVSQLDSFATFAAPSWEVDPDTGVAWTKTGVEALEFGAEYD